MAPIIIFIGTLLTTLLTSCASLPPPEAKPHPVLSKAARTQALARRNTFNAKGVLSIRADQQAGHLNWQWQQTPSTYTLTLWGPLGAGTVRLEGTQSHVLLEKANGQKISAHNPDQLLLKETGWAVPVSGMSYWIRSLPVPQHPAIKTYDAANRLTLLKQQGWTIQYLHYENRAGLDLPDRITLSRQGLFLKIVVKQFTIPTGSP